MPDTTVTSADGTKLAARHSGDGSPLVLVHGANGDRDTFALIEGLLAERHSVWVYSRRGRGGSGDGVDYSLQKEVDDVLAVLAAAGDRAHLVGHSGGAVYSVLAAMQSPPLRSLVLYEPPLRLDRLDTSLVDDMQAAVEAGDPDRALEIFFPATATPDHEVQVLRSLEPIWERIREGVQRVPREIRLSPEERDRVMAFHPPDVPTLYLYGEETDAPIFPTLEDVAERLPNAQLHGLPGQRHLAFGFDPTAFAQAVLAFTTAHDD
jgi:pimeloyl-ACP methyl ester carboxylesterase